MGQSQQHNVSYVDPKLPRATLKQALRHYLASAAIYGGILLFFSFNPWFRELLSVRVAGRRALVWYRYIYLTYLVVGPVIFFGWRPRSLWVSKNLRVVGYLGRVTRRLFGSSGQGAKVSLRPSYEETHAMMFLLVKMFYGPLMINSALTGYRAIPQFLEQTQAQRSWGGFFDQGYMLLVMVVFFLDSALFAVGYHSESGLMRNRLRYVETNPLHILVCVCCYPPFNMPTTAFFGPSNRDPYIVFAGDPTHPVTWLLRVLAVLSLLLLLSASYSLFTKASNLTNRGIVHWGPYRYIRHPGYLGKNLYWLMTTIPIFFPDTSSPLFKWSDYLGFCVTAVGGLIGWGTIYFLRSITEERFLMRDPDYVAYCRKVKYRFIPGVY